MIVVKPSGTPARTNIDRSDEPRTISGTAIARKMTKSMVVRPRNLYRPKASPNSAPTAVEIAAEIGAILSEFLNAGYSPGTLKTFFHQSSVRPQNFAVWRSNGTLLNP